MSKDEDYLTKVARELLELEQKEKHEKKGSKEGIGILWGSLLYFASIAASCALSWGVANFIGKLLPGDDGMALGMMSMFIIPFIFIFINVATIPKIAGIERGNFVVTWILLNIFLFIAFWMFAMFSIME